MFANFFSKTVGVSLLLALLTCHPRCARAADDDTRTVLAQEVLELAYSPNNLRDSFAGFLEPALDAMKRDGMPDAARDEVRAAFKEWFNQEVKWAEIKPKLVEIYAHDFTTEELRALLAFLDKPLGQTGLAEREARPHRREVQGQAGELKKNRNSKCQARETCAATGSRFFRRTRHRMPASVT